MKGQGEAGMTQIRQGIAALQAAGAGAFVPGGFVSLAAVCDPLGHPEDGLQALAEAHTLVEQHESRWCEAEISRLRGVLLLRQTRPQQEEAKSLELRAAMSPRTPVAAAGQTPGGSPTAGADLRLVH